ncbi:hypothetical protein BpHYR1_033687 [Brachionus plicatilis]|uniref:Uncharacterized protein n=1 Tax=Brachionus plicatilis TaxID=10195 RepID=A0A3M7Q7L9_BRAPC|nr:hypothetical protein BpHYR1_033687 [Brachionus plicatilis]
MKCFINFVPNMDCKLDLVEKNIPILPIKTNGRDKISLKNIENLIDQFYAKISFQIFNLYKFCHIHQKLKISLEPKSIFCLVKHFKY